MLTFHETTEEEKYSICEWHYKGAYAIYDNPHYEEMKKKKSGFANPQNWFLSFYDGNQFVGFTNLIEEKTEVFVGIGVEPSHCGKGYGRQMLERIISIASSRFPKKPLYLEVRTWNERALRCYRHAGFQICGEPFSQTTGAGEGVFYRMEYQKEEA